MRGGRGACTDTRPRPQPRLRPHLHPHPQVALGTVGQMLHVNPNSNFGFAGTKDKRGVTGQWVTAWKVPAAKLAGLNARLRGIRLGNFE